MVEVLISKNIKVIKIFIFCFVIVNLFFVSEMSFNSLYSQSKNLKLKEKEIEKVKKKKKRYNKNNKNNQNIITNLNKKNKSKLNLINYAKRAERRGDNRSANQYYKRLIKIDNTDIEIIDGYIRTSIVLQNIKQCQTTLTNLLSIHESGKISSTITNTNSKTISSNDIFYFKLLSEIAYFYIATNREQIADQYISKINSSSFLNYKTKKILYSDIYEKSGDISQAIKILLDARNNNNNKSTDQTLNKFMFSAELYKLYFDNLDFKNSAIELANYLLLSHSNQNLISKSHKFNSFSLQSSSSLIDKTLSKIPVDNNYIQIETKFIKLFDNISEEKEKLEIIETITKKSEKNSLIELLVEMNPKQEKDSINSIYLSLEGKFKKLLFSLYFKNKEYEKAFKYLTNEKNIDTFTNISNFANQLYNENEYDLAYKYYLNLLKTRSGSINYLKINKNQFSRNIKLLLDNYISVLIELNKYDEAVSFLNDLIKLSNDRSSSSSSTDRKMIFEKLVLDERFPNFVSKSELNLKLAEIYQYNIFDTDKAMSIYLDKFNLNNVIINKKISSSLNQLKAAINLYELFIFNEDKKRSDQLSEYIENNNYFYRDKSENERYSYLFILSSLLILDNKDDNNYNLFIERVDSFIKKKLDSNYSNDLLSLYFKIKSIIPKTKDGKINQNKDNKVLISNLITSFVKFKINKNFIVKENLFNISNYKSETEKQFVINFNYNYLKSNLRIDELDILIKSIMFDSISSTDKSLNIGSKGVNNYDEIFLDYVIFKKNYNTDKKVEKEVLTFFINNFDSSVLYDEARRLLRQM